MKRQIVEKSSNPEEKKIKRNLIILLLVFFLLATAYIIINPVLEGPDSPGHYTYATYIAVNNKLPAYIKGRSMGAEAVRNHHPEVLGKDYFMVISGDYALTDIPGNEASYGSQAHHPPLYYIISALLIKPFNNLKDLQKIRRIPGEGYNVEYKWDGALDNSIYKDISGKLLLDKSGIFASAYLLKFVQVIYGIIISIFIFKIFKILQDNRIDQYSIWILSLIFYLPSFLFLCTNINNDVLSILFAVVAIYYIILLNKFSKIKYGYFAISFSLIALATKYTAISVLIFSFLYFLIWSIKNKKKRHYIPLLISLFILIISSSVILLIAEKTGSDLIIHLKGAFFDRIVKGFLSLKAIIAKQYFIEFLPKLGLTSIASFDTNHVIADHFLYYFYYGILIAGLGLFFNKFKRNICATKGTGRILLFSITSVLLVFIVRSAEGNYTGWGGRYIFVAIIIIFILTISGFEKLDLRVRKIFYFSITTYVILLNLFCIYEYIYLFFYKNITTNFLIP